MTKTGSLAYLLESFLPLTIIMKYLTFRNGDRLPALGLGTWKSGTGEVYEAVRTAIRNGYRHIDCAAIYGNEAEIGEALQDAMTEDGAERSDLFITSKLWNDSHRRDEVEPALHKTLSDLQLDYLDLYLIHWPVAIKKTAGFPRKADDYIPPSEAPIEDTWRGMEECRELGLTRHVGVSNFGINRLNQLIRSCEIVPEMEQVELHPYLRQKQLLSFCREHDMLLTAYSPLGSSDRSAAMKRENEPNLLSDEVINTIARETGYSPAQVILAWSIIRGTAVIPKSVNKDRQQENLAAADLALSESQMDRLNALNRDYRFIDGSLWEADGAPYDREYIFGA